MDINSGITPDYRYIIAMLQEEIDKLKREKEIESNNNGTNGRKLLKPINYQSNILTAASKGDIESVKYILQEDPGQISRNSIFIFGNHSALFYALSGNHFDCAVELIRLNCPISEKDLMTEINGHTFLFYSLLNKQFELSRNLIKKGCKLPKSDLKEFFFTYGCEKGDLQTLEIIVLLDKSVLRKTKGGHHGIYYAVKNYHIGAVMYLFSQGCNLSPSDNLYFFFIQGCENGDLEVLQIVSKLNTSIFTLKKDDHNGIYYSVKNLHEDVSKYLHNHGCTLSLTDCRDFFFLQGCQKGDIRTLDIVTQLNPSVLNETDKGHTGLFMAIKNSNFDVAQYILTKGVKMRQNDLNNAHILDQIQHSFILQNQVQIISKIPPMIPSTHHDIFQGIFCWMKNQFGADFVKNGMIEISASSVSDGNFANVLKKDDSWWKSDDVQNSWIQFDFKSNVILLKSYSLRSLAGPYSWRVEGSNDMVSFILIDQRNFNNDFKLNQCVSQHYEVSLSVDCFRYIRITQGDDGRVCRDHKFSLKEVEFYGLVYESTGSRILEILSSISEIEYKKYFNSINNHFQGIFDWMKNEFGNDCFNNGIIDISSSSVDCDNVPNHVLKKDDSYWLSKNSQFSWIQFDFKSKSIYLQSYTLRSEYGPKSWRIEGSNDMNTFTLIDQRNHPNDFKSGKYITQHYDVQPHLDRYRCIRITQGLSGRHGCPIDRFWLNRVEFYGSLFE